MGGFFAQVFNVTVAGETAEGGAGVTVWAQFAGILMSVSSAFSSQLACARLAMLRAAQKVGIVDVLKCVFRWMVFWRFDLSIKNDEGECASRLGELGYVALIYLVCRETGGGRVMGPSLSSSWNRALARGRKYEGMMSCGWMIH